MTTSVDSYGYLHTAVTATSDGANSVITAVPGKKIRVVAFVLSADATGDATLRDTSADTTRLLLQFANAGESVSYSGPVPIFETAVGEGLEINTTSSQDVQGAITYQLI